LEQIDLLAKTASVENYQQRWTRERRKLSAKVDERTCFITIFNTKRGVGKRKKTPQSGVQKRIQMLDMLVKHALERLIHLLRRRTKKSPSAKTGFVFDFSF